MPEASFAQWQIREQLDRAIGEGDVDSAWGLAKRLYPVPVDKALALTVLLGRKSDPRFDAAALRLVERFCAEAEPNLEAISKVCDALATL